MTIVPNLKLKREAIVLNDGIIDKTVLFERISAIIENRKSRVAAYVNSVITLMYWEVGRYINSVIFDFKRAEYGKKIFAALSRKLVEAYSGSFEEKIGTVFLVYGAGLGQRLGARDSGIHLGLTVMKMRKIMKMNSTTTKKPFNT
jgi:hypothetical protein